MERLQKPEFEKLENRLHLDANIETIPPAVITPGNDYVMYVYADNTGLNGEQTEGINWKVWPEAEKSAYGLVPNYNVNFTEARLPLENDFFEGKNMWRNEVEMPGTASSRSVDIGESGVINGSGNLGEYVFNINDYNGQWGIEDNFLLFVTDFVAPGGTTQPLTVINHPFKIVAYLGDLDNDGDVDIFDFAIFQPNYGKSGMTYDDGDLDLDGDVDIFDFAIFQPNYGKSVGGVVPEPVTSALLGAGFAGLMAKENKRRRKASELEKSVK